MDVRRSRRAAAFSNAPHRRARASGDAFPGFAGEGGDTAMHIAAGQRIGNYILQEPVGRGAFAEVWKAVHHERRGRTVAIKLVRDAEYTRQLRREADLPELGHPSVVPILDCDTTADPPYVVMPFYAAGSLADLLARHPDGLPEERVEQILGDLLAGLAAAHERGILHRDLKPANILLDDSGRALISDFGLRGLSEGGETLLRSISLEREARTLAGTLGWMAPEVLHGGQYTAASDVYSVGLMLFQMLTGRSPMGLELPSTVHPGRLSKAEWWDGLFERACAAPEKRFADARAFAAALSDRPGADQPPAPDQTSDQRSEPLEESTPATAGGWWLLLRTLMGHGSGELSVAFSPDGRTLASGSWDRTIRLWRIPDGALLRTLEGHRYGVSSVAFSPDGRTLASEGDMTIRLWRVSDGALLRTLKGHRGGVTSVAFSPDGQTLASGSYDTTVKLWRVSAGRSGES